jgi:hypothetical protein
VRRVLAALICKSSLDPCIAGIAERNLQVADMNMLAIKLGYVLFNDGIQWSEGSLYKPNPDGNFR